MANLNLTARFGIDGRGFKSGLDSIESQTKKFVYGIGRKFVALFGTAAIGRAFKETIENAGRIQDVSAGLGLTVKQFQELEFAAKQSGANIEQIAVSIRKIASTQQNAFEGQQASVKLFERLGISMEKLRSMSPQQLFMHIAKQVKEGTIGVQNMADMIDLLGKGAATPVLNAMQEDIGNLIEQFNTLNLAIGDESIEALSRLGDEWTTLSTRIKTSMAESTVSVVKFLRESFAGLSMLGAGLKGYFTAKDPWKPGNANKAFMDAMEKEFQIQNAQIEKETESVEQQAKARRERAEKGNLLAIDELGKIQPKETKTTAAKIASDQLARIGGFTGAHSKTISLAEKNVKTLEQIRRALEVNGIKIRDAL